MIIRLLVLASSVFLSSIAHAEISSLLKENVIQRLSQAKAERYANLREESEQLERIDDALNRLVVARSRLESQTAEYQKIEGEIWLIKIKNRFGIPADEQTRLAELQTRLEELEKTLRQPLAELLKVDKEIGTLKAKAAPLERKLDEFTASRSRISEVEFYSLLPQQYGKCKFKRIDAENLSVNVEGNELQVKLDPQGVQGKAVTSLGSNLLIIQNRTSESNSSTATVTLTYNTDSDRIISLFVIGTPWSKLGSGTISEWPNLYRCTPLL